MLAAELAADPLTLAQFVAFVVLTVGEVLAVVFVYRVLVRGGSPASSLLWVVVILSAPWLGLFLYYLLPRRLQRRRLKRIQKRGARARRIRGPRGALAGTDGASDSGLIGLLGGADGEGLCGGNAVQWLPGGEQFFAAAEAAIGAAKHHVHCVVYIFRPDEVGLRFLELLTAAAQRGVTVRLLFDSMGSFGLKSAHLAPLRKAGGRAEAFLPLLWKRRPFTINLRNHRKLLIVDDEVGFVGGRNIGNEYRTDRLGRSQRWLDAMVAIRGPAVAMLRDVFVEDWCTATDHLVESGVAPGNADACERGSERVAIACSGPDREVSRLWFAVVQALGGATTTIELSSPYLVPPPVLLFALELAVARGVRVRIHTNGRSSEAAILYFAQRSFYRRMLRAGIQIHETVADYNHSKLLVVDGETVIVGSANMDMRSAGLNFEIAAIVVDAPQFAAAVQATVEERCAGSRRVSAAHLPRNPLWRAVDGLCGLLSPLL